ncbi:MAG: helix-turn-helix domain-containing protein [Candidatus Aenigmatarchaeota archaeon]
MKDSEIIEFLRSLGLSDYESRVYYALISSGPSKALNLSASTGVPQSKIYATLESLIEKNLVEVSTGRPKKYKAITPSIGFKNLLKFKEEEMERIKTKLNEIEKILLELPKKSSDIISGIWSMKTNKWMEFFDRVAEMLNRSKNYVYAITRDYSQTSSLMKAARVAVKRGVKIRVIGMEPPKEDNLIKIKIYHKNGVELKYLTNPVLYHPRIVVVDGKEAIIRLDNDFSKKEGFAFNAIWTQDPAMVLVLDNYLKSLWEKSEAIKLN